MQCNVSFIPLERKKEGERRGGGRDTSIFRSFSTPTSPLLRSTMVSFPDINLWQINIFRLCVTQCVNLP